MKDLPPLNLEEFNLLIKHHKDTCDVVSSRWTLPILYRLNIGNVRKCDLRKEIKGLKERTEERVVKDLILNRLVERIDVNKDGKIIEYAILPSGKAFVNLFYCSAEAGKVYRNLLHPKQN